MGAKTKSIVFTIFIIVFVGSIVLFLQNSDLIEDQNTESSTKELEKNIKKVDSIQIEFSELETAYNHLSNQFKDSVYLLIKQIEMLERKNKAFLSYQEYLNKGLDSLQFEINQLKLVNKQLKDDLSIYVDLNNNPSICIETKYSDSVKLEPSGSYFYSYIKIIHPSIYIAKAIFKDKNGEIIREVLEPEIINTNKMPTGLYYLSLYDKDEKLIKCKVVYKKRRN